jgi:hypothetical protein
MQKRFVRSVCALGVLGAASAFASTVTPLPIPLVADNWHTESEQGFVALKD